MGSVKCGFDIGRVGASDLAHRQADNRRNIVEIFTDLGCPPLAADEVVISLSKGRLERRTYVELGHVFLPFSRRNGVGETFIQTRRVEQVPRSRRTRKCRKFETGTLRIVSTVQTELFQPAV